MIHSELFLLAVAATGLSVAWLICHALYRRIHGHSLRWWAIPFSQGALLFDRRLKRWER